MALYTFSQTWDICLKIFFQVFLSIFVFRAESKLKQLLKLKDSSELIHFSMWKSLKVRADFKKIFRGSTMDLNIGCGDWKQLYTNLCIHW